MSEIHFVTSHKVLKAVFYCNKCGHRFIAYFIDSEVLDFLECDCGFTAHRVK